MVLMVIVMFVWAHVPSSGFSSPQLVVAIAVGQFVWNGVDVRKVTLCNGDFGDKSYMCAHKI